MGVFPENPCEFAVEFIRRMRNHPDIIVVPSSRQVLSIPKMILSRYYRKGVLAPKDFIEISAVTSYPDNQDLARTIAFDILFPSYKNKTASDFFGDDGIIRTEEVEDQLKSEMEQLQELIDEIENKALESSATRELENFLEELSENRTEEPYRSALNFFNDDSEIYKEQITSLEQLLEEARNRLEQKINSLEPDDIEASNCLGLDQLIQDKSFREWEKITSKALDNQDIESDLEQLINSNNVEDLIQSIKYLKETNALSKEQLNDLKGELSEQIKTLDELFSAAKNLGEAPKFDPETLMQNSMNQSSFDHNFNLANSLDQYFGTDLRSLMLEMYDKKYQGPDLKLTLEQLTENAMANKSWNSLFKKSLQNALNDANNQPKINEALKSLSHQVQQLQKSSRNIQSSQKIAQHLPELVRKTMESSNNSDQLKDAVEFLRKVGLNPESDDIRRMGQNLQMPEEEIIELIEPNYQLLKNLIEQNNADFQRLSGLMNQIKDQLSKERISELTNISLESDNREALGALGHFDLGEALESANQSGGIEGEDKLISSLTAGSGKNLLEQWFIHRDHLPASSKAKVKEVAKALLIELGVYYSRARLGSSITGPIPINTVRPYTVGDDFENVDLEETIFHILEKGKKLEHISYDDFFVYETAKGLRTACIEMDISGSMEGEKLAQMAICSAMLVYGLQKDELALCFFESDTHVLKGLDEEIELEQLADEILSIKAEGGTRIQKALEWAREEFKKNSSSREKLNLLFTDAEVFDLEQAMEELKIMRSIGVNFVIICPETQFNLKDAEKMAKIAGGQLLTINKWEEFPKLISDIIKSKF
ncbi:MAG: VWA domain-containing protein [Promethearchaeota archaeon]